MNTKTIIALPIAVLSAIALTLTVSVMLTLSASAETKPVIKAQTKPAVTSSSAANYAYTAQSGDSYSKIARKAIQTYGIKNKINLSNSRIVYAETGITQAAGSPQLLKGQKVTISESTIKQWVDKAKGLSKDQAAKWDKYTVGVNFDTRAVGEVK